MRKISLYITEYKNKTVREFIKSYHFNFNGTILCVKCFVKILYILGYDRIIFGSITLVSFEDVKDSVNAK